MVHFEVKIYHHKVASFKDVCTVVVMVLGDKAQNYLAGGGGVGANAQNYIPPPPPPPPPIIVLSPVADILEVWPAIGNYVFTKRTAKCVQVKVVTMDTIFIKLLS